MELTSFSVDDTIVAKKYHNEDDVSRRTADLCAMSR